jgi:hypothetical protein
LNAALRLASPLLRACGFVHRDSTEGRALARETAWEKVIKRGDLAVYRLNGSWNAIHHGDHPLRRLSPAARDEVKRLMDAFREWEGRGGDVSPFLKHEIYHAIAEICECAQAMTKDRTLRTEPAETALKEVASQLIDVIGRAGKNRPHENLVDFNLGLDTLDRQFPLRIST